MGVADDDRGLRLWEEQRATFRRVFGDPVVGFASYDGSIEPLSPTEFKVNTSLIVHCCSSVEICCGEVEICWADEVYPTLFFPIRAQARIFRPGRPNLGPSAAYTGSIRQPEKASI